MSVRKRKWTTAKGVQKEAWLVDYTDQHGKRHAKTFAKKKDADAFAATTHVEVRSNTHIADSDTVTVEEAGQLWLKRAKQKLERGTVDQYRQHLDLHITPYLGRMKLSKITVPVVRKFMDDLEADGRSAPMVRGVRTSLGSILAEAQERGLVVRNAVREMSSNRARSEAKGVKRRKARLTVGKDIPTRDEIRAILDQLNGKATPYRALIVTAIFTGMRASELRGLRWADVDLEGRKLHVRQRADKYHDIGSPKSDAGKRTIPLFLNVVNTLAEWKRVCPKRDGELDLVFPTGTGKVESHSNIVKRGLWKPQIDAGICIDTGEVDEKGKSILRAKYTGLHSLRHWFASWCINSKNRGGRGMSPKEVQEVLGHSTIVLTLDTYGHLFEAHGDEAAMADAEAALLAPLSATQTQHAR